MYIKYFNKFIFNKTKKKNKKYLCKYCWQCFSSESVLVKHKEIGLKISGKETVKLKSGFTEFKNYFSQIPAPFQIYADFECILKSVKSNEGFYTEKHQNHIPCSFSYKLVCVDNKFSKPIVVYRGGNTAYRFIAAILQECEYCKKVMKKPFNKNLIISEKEEENFWSSNACWICEKLIDDEKGRDHYRTTGKYRGAARRSCNVNLKLTKKVVIIFHNLKGYDSHLIINDIGKLNVKVDLIPNGLEKYMALTIYKHLVFIDSKQFMNSSLEKLAKNLSDDNFKHLPEEFVSKNLKLLIQKDAYPYEYMDSFERLSEKRLPDKKHFYRSLKHGTTNDKGTKLDSHTTDKEKLTCIKIWNRFIMKNMADYHEHY